MSKRHAIVGAHDRAAFRAVYDGFVEATRPLIEELIAAGVTHPPQIAAALNRRGIPAYGRRRWTGSLVRAVLGQGCLSEPP